MAVKRKKVDPSAYLYGIRKNGQTFDLVEIAREETIHPVALPLTLHDIAIREREAKHEKSIKQEIFLGSMMIVIEGERQQSVIVSKLRNKSARHIKTSPLVFTKLLKVFRCRSGSIDGREDMPIDNDKDTVEDKGEESSEDRDIMLINLIINPPVVIKEEPTALQVAWQKWGLAKAPAGSRYLLSDRQTALVGNETCRQLIEQTRALYGDSITKSVQKGLINALETQISEGNDENNAAIDEVIKKIRKSKTRDHLSAISLSTAGGELTTIYVGLANPAGDTLTVEGWKFVKILEEPDTYQLIGDPPPQPAGSEPSLFAFAGRDKKSEKNRMDSDYAYVYARFETESATLEVVRTDAGGKGVRAKAAFILDPDYLFFLCESLKYLREDRERFARLREKADLKTTINVESLDKLFTSTPLKGK